LLIDVIAIPVQPDTADVPVPGSKVNLDIAFNLLTLRVPPMPTPPATTNDPVPVDVEATATGNEITSPIVSITNAGLLDPSFTEKAVVEELLWVNVPDNETEPLFKTTPERELAKEEDENNVPPMPTPPVTIKAPVDDDVEPNDEVTANPETLSMSVDGL
jgi:hypothetical protein